MRKILALLVAVLPFAVPAGEIAQDALQSGDAAAGKIWFDGSCSQCHRSLETLLPGIPGAEACEQAAWLDGFLVNHRAPNADMRRDIIAYLLSQPR